VCSGIDSIVGWEASVTPWVITDPTGGISLGMLMVVGRGEIHCGIFLLS
jgi:hypothetical protein